MKTMSKRPLALLLISALLTGLLPLGTGTKSRAVEQSLRNLRILKTTQEVAPGSSEKKELKNPTTDSSGITTWDCLWFGNYWQEDTNGDGKADKNDEKTPIKWRVLSVEGDDVFLVADKNLDCQRYNDTSTDVTWETCTMRSWLNGYGAEANQAEKDYSGTGFLDNAFTAEEREAIKTTNVVNDDDSKYGTEGGNNTSDKVYLLSINEVTNPAYGFTSSIYSTATRVAVNTAYTVARGEIGSEYMGSAGYADSWWLRSPGYGSNVASSVASNGYVSANGDFVSIDFYAVRPALHLNLSSDSSWFYAGTVPSDDVAEWDCLWFGNYWQEDTNGDGKADKNDEKTPIKWRVLSVEGDDVFLVADKNLDCQTYNDTYTDVTWETCTMRSWLNGYGAEANQAEKDYSGTGFLDNAFTAEEREAIKTTNVVNNDNPKYGTEGGNDTTDEVYLLSIDEVRSPAYGFLSSTGSTATRVAVNTAYTAAGGEIGSEYMESAGNANYWWLRSPGHISDNASIVLDSGNVGTSGNNVNSNYYAVRPALHLNLKASSDVISLSSWSYAGTVTSDGKVEEIEAPKPIVTPSPEPGSTQKPQATSEPGTTSQPGNTEKPSAAPAVTPSPEPGNTQKPQVTSEPGTTSQPGNTGKPSTAPTAAPSPEPGSIGKVFALKLKQKKGTVTASWKKTAGVGGYQICYSTSRKWKNKKQKPVSKNKTVIKKLKKKKTYYFRVRAYRLEGKKKVYGAWSATKKIKIKK